MLFHLRHRLAIFAAYFVIDKYSFMQLDQDNHGTGFGNRICCLVIKFVTLAIEFILLAIEFVISAIEFVTLALEFITMAQDFIIIKY